MVVVVLKIRNYGVLMFTDRTPLVVIVELVDWLDCWWSVVEDSLLLDVVGVAGSQTKYYPAAG